MSKGEIGMHIGLFRVSGSFLREAGQDMLILTQKDMAVVGMVHDTYLDIVEIKAVGSMFRDVPEGSPIPSYELTFNSDTSQVCFKEA